MITLITYADGGNYAERAEKIFQQTSGMFEKQICYGRKSFSSDFIERNKNILSQPRGAGYWVWKPYIILKTLKSSDDGDIVYYMDSGDFIYNDIRQFIINTINQNDGFLLVRSVHSHKAYTKRDCFYAMDCDTPEFHNLIQLEAGCVGFRKEEKTINFVKEWLRWCQQESVIDDTYTKDNYIGFIDHRHDQSILTNIVQMKNLKTVSIHEIKKYVYFNIDKV